MVTLAELRWKNRRMTQEQLAAFIGVSRVTVARYECGMLKPRASRIARIAQALNVDSDIVWQMFYGNPKEA